MFIEGSTAPAYAPLKDAFAQLWTDSVEVGAAMAVYHRGVKVVDLWAGLADSETDRPWTSETPALTFSVSKGVLAICVLSLVEQGRIDLDAPVRSYWPEFSGGGKDRITTGWVLSHRAGLAYLDTPLTRTQVNQWHPVVHAIEAQRPNWEPNAAYAYHAQTYGFILGELIARVTGLSPTDFFAEVLGEPLAVSGWWGAPSTTLSAIARISAPVPSFSDDRVLRELDEFLDQDDRTWRSVTLNGAVNLPMGGRRNQMDYNDPDILQASLPGSNLVLTARDLARIYASTVSSVDGHRTLNAETVDLATRPKSVGPELYGIGAPTEDARRGLGFQLSSSPTRPWLGSTSFGHDGASGSVGFADADLEIGFGYLNNRLVSGHDGRAQHLIGVLRNILDA